MKFMNLKRFASTVMAGVLTLSLAVPAFAADTQPENSTVVTATYAEIPIAVEVPTTGTAQLNPYGLPVTVTKSDEKTVDLVGQKITTQPLSIKNQGTTALEVGATLAVVPKGEVSIAASANNDKAIKVDLEVASLDDATLAVSSTSTKLEDMLIDKFASRSTWLNATTLAAPVAPANATTVAPAESDADSPLATLGAATVKGEVITYAKDSIALFRLTGDLAQSPKTGNGASAIANPWEATDGFTATVVFKFIPAPPSAGDATLTLDKTTLNAAGNLVATFDAGTSGLTVESWSWSAQTSASGIADVTVTSANNDGNAAVTVAAAGNTTGDTNDITVTVTLSNGATLSATCVYTHP